ncbi:MAG: NAD(P)-dependent oxidoreductase [Pseudomonadota bacterium]
MQSDGFRVGLSGDFINADGSMKYPSFDLEALRSTPRVTIDFLPPCDPIKAELLENIDALILLGARLTADSIPASGRLSVVARFGVGYDSVDVAACTAKDIAVCITPDGVRRPVAASILTLILALTGKLVIKDRLTRRGPDGFGQARSAHMGLGLVERVLGSIGIGNIGAEMFRLVQPLGMKFIAHDPFANPKTAGELGVELVDLETLFRMSDVLTVNCPLTPDTHHLVNAERIALMKPTSYLINTARGPIVDQKALTAALQGHLIAGAGLDVFEKEPPDADDPLLHLDNVIVTPHALCWTDQCFAGIGASDVASVLAIYEGRRPAGLLNQSVTVQKGFIDKLERYEKISHREGQI